MTNSEVYHARRLYVRGMTLREISARFNCTIQEAKEVVTKRTTQGVLKREKVTSSNEDYIAKHGLKNSAGNGLFPGKGNDIQNRYLYPGVSTRRLPGSYGSANR